MKISPADKAFSDCVREAADNTCARCGLQGRVECSHIHGRRHRTIRWAKENAVAKCHGCHRWWHENPTEAAHWFQGQYGQGVIDRLREKLNCKVKVTKKEESEIARHYRLQLKGIRERRANGETGPLQFESYQ